jgi:hypothetical protein
MPRAYLDRTGTAASVAGFWSVCKDRVVYLEINEPLEVKKIARVHFRDYSELSKGKKF